MTVPGVPLRVVERTTSTACGTTGPALAGLVRELAPDVVIVQEAPRRFRWRHKCAALADDVRHGGGGRRAARAGQPAADQPAGAGRTTPGACGIR